MTDTDIVTRLAREADLARPDDPRTGYARFAALVAEECAQIAAGTYEGGCSGQDGDSGYDFYGENSAEAIRAKFKA